MPSSSSFEDYPIPSNKKSVVKKGSTFLKRMGLGSKSASSRLNGISVEKLKLMHIPHGSILSLNTSDMKTESSVEIEHDHEKPLSEKIVEEKENDTETEKTVVDPEDSPLPFKTSGVANLSTTRAASPPLEVTKSSSSEFQGNATDEQGNATDFVLPSINTNRATPEMVDYPILEETSASPQDHEPFIRALLQNTHLITSDTPVLPHPPSFSPIPLDGAMELNFMTGMGITLNSDIQAPSEKVNSFDVPIQSPTRKSESVIQIEDDTSELYYHTQVEDEDSGTRKSKRKKSRGTIKGLFRSKSFRDLLRPKQNVKGVKTVGPEDLLTRTTADEDLQSSKRVHSYEPRAASVNDEPHPAPISIPEKIPPIQQPSFETGTTSNQAKEPQPSKQEEEHKEQDLEQRMLPPEVDLTPLSEAIIAEEAALKQYTNQNDNNSIHIKPARADTEQDYIFYDMVESNDSKQAGQVRKRKSVGQKLSSFFNKSMEKMKMGLRKKKNMATGVVPEEREELFSFDEAFRPDGETANPSPVELDDELLSSNGDGLRRETLPKLPPPYIRIPLEGEEHEEYSKNKIDGVAKDDVNDAEESDYQYLASVRRRNSLHSVSSNATIMSERVRLEGDLPEFDQLDSVADKRSLAEKVRSLLQLDEVKIPSDDQNIQSPPVNAVISTEKVEQEQIQVVGIVSERVVNIVTYHDDVHDDSDPFSEKQPEIAPRKSMTDLRLLRMADERSPSPPPISTAPLEYSQKPLPVISPKAAISGAVSLTRSKSMSSIGSNGSGSSRKSPRSVKPSSSKKKSNKTTASASSVVYPPLHENSTSGHDQLSTSYSNLATSTKTWGVSDSFGASNQRLGPYSSQLGHRASRSTTVVSSQRAPSSSATRLRRPSLQSEIQAPRGLSPALSSIQDILDDVAEFVHELDPSFDIDKTTKKRQIRPRLPLAVHQEEETTDIEDGPISPIKRQGVAVFDFPFNLQEAVAGQEEQVDPDAYSVNEYDVLNDYFVGDDGASIRSRKSRRSSIASSVRSKRVRPMSMTLAAFDLSEKKNMPKEDDVSDLHSAPVASLPSVEADVAAHTQEDSTLEMNLNEEIKPENKSIEAPSAPLATNNDLVTQVTTDDSASRVHNPLHPDEQTESNMEEEEQSSSIHDVDTSPQDPAEDDDENMPLGTIKSRMWGAHPPVESLDSIEVEGDESKEDMDHEYLKRVRKRYSQTSLYSVKNESAVEHVTPSSGLKSESSKQPKEEEPVGSAAEPPAPSDTAGTTAVDTAPPSPIQEEEQAPPEPIVRKLRRKLTWSKTKPGSKLNNQSTASSTTTFAKSDNTPAPPSVVQSENRLQARLKMRVLEHVNKPAADGIYGILSTEVKMSPPATNSSSPSNDVAASAEPDSIAKSDEEETKSTSETRIATQGGPEGGAAHPISPSEDIIDVDASSQQASSGSALLGPLENKSAYRLSYDSAVKALSPSTEGPDSRRASHPVGHQSDPELSSVVATSDRKEHNLSELGVPEIIVSHE